MNIDKSLNWSLINAITSRLLDSAFCFEPTDLCDTKLLQLDFSPMDNKLRNRQHNYMNSSKSIFIKWLGRKWGNIFLSYCKHLVPINQIVLRILCYNISKHTYMTERSLIKLLKTVGANALKLMDQGIVIAKDLINLEVLGGYDTVLNRVDILAEQKAKVAFLPDGADKMSDDLKTEIDKVVDQIRIKKEGLCQTFKTVFGI